MPTSPRLKAEPAVKVRNAACPSCNKPLYFSDTHWLHCRAACCIRYTLAKKGGAK